jgi:hypothetical protein
MEVADASSWIQAITMAVDAGAERPVELVLPAAGDVPELAARLSAPQALVRVFPHVDSATSSLIAGLARPVQGLFWSSPGQERFDAPAMVEVDGKSCAGPTVNLVGIHITPDWVASSLATPTGLLVGCAERRAWLRETRGADDLAHFVVDLGWDPGRLALADLELTHEQYVGGDIASAITVRLEDLDLSVVETSGACRVSFMNLGREIVHGITLRHIEGELLDRIGPYPLAETVEIGFTINGEEQAPIVRASSQPAPTLDQRTERAREIAADLQHMLRSAAQARIIADRQTAVARLAAYLEGARGELCILDRYFGQSVNDWRLLDNVPVPVRVLTGKLEKDPSRHLVLPRLGRHVQARYRPNAALHERVYFWDGGGIVVGGSPTTFGQAPVRMTRMPPTEVDEWRVLFEAEWKSPLYNPVPSFDQD